MMYEEMVDPESGQMMMVRKEKRDSKDEGGERKRSDIIDMSGMSLDHLPNPPSQNLAAITKLDISNNNLQVIPESVTARLLNLVVLDARSNQLKAMPNSIGCLSKLKILNVSGNQIQSFPVSIQNCRSLEELNANFNQLTRLPDNIGFELGHLKKLSINSNKLICLPHSITHITSLKVLDAKLNCLRALPDDLENFINLEVLNVGQNFQYLHSLPYSIGLLISLVELDVSYNDITTLPDSIGCLRKLQKLSVEGNPLVSPPMEIVEQSLLAVKEYMSERMNAAHKSPQKKKPWALVHKLVKFGTFHGAMRKGAREDREELIMPEYHLDGDDESPPKSTGGFSPRRLFSPRTYFNK